jgi:hypothetical protein
MRNFGLTFFSLLICLPTAFAQTDRATLTGTVTDAQGAAVRGAQVTAKAVASGIVHTVVTNSAGLYVIGSLPVGEYTETVVDNGFQPVQFRAFSLKVGENRELNATLVVSSVETVVQVSTEEDDLNRVSTEIGGVVQGAQLHELPLNGHSFERL